MLVSQTYGCGQALGPEVKHPEIHRYALNALDQCCRHTDSYGRHLMDKNRIELVAQGQIERNQTRRDKVAQVVERKCNLSALTSRNDKATNDLHAIDILHPTIEQAITIEKPTLRIVWDGGHHRNIVASTLKFEGDVVALEVLGLEILRNQQYALFCHRENYLRQTILFTTPVED